MTVHATSHPPRLPHPRNSTTLVTRSAGKESDALSKLVTGGNKSYPAASLKLTIKWTILCSRFGMREGTVTELGSHPRRSVYLLLEADRKPVRAATLLNILHYDVFGIRRAFHLHCVLRT